MKLPHNLNTAPFIELFKEWVEYRKVVKRKPLHPATIERQLKKLSRWGVAKAMQSIENSMDNEYQGLFEPKNYQKKSYLTDNAYDHFKRQQQKEIKKTGTEPNTAPEIARIFEGMRVKTVDGQIGGGG